METASLAFIAGSLTVAAVLIVLIAHLPNDWVERDR
jgi:hypothetical protein